MEAHFPARRACAADFYSFLNGVFLNRSAALSAPAGPAVKDVLSCTA